jgi:hypothetical protein
MNKLEFVASLEKKIEVLKNRLLESTNVSAKGFKVISRALINKNDSCIAYLSCVRNPKEESIDLTIDVFFKSNSIFLDAGIYWSDGTFIEDLRSTEIPIDDSQETENSLTEFFNQLLENDLKKYADFVLRQKDASS